MISFATSDTKHWGRVAECPFIVNIPMTLGDWSDCVVGAGVSRHYGHLYVQSGRASQVNMTMMQPFSDQTHHTIINNQIAVLSRRVACQPSPSSSPWSTTWSSSSFAQSTLSKRERSLQTSTRLSTSDSPCTLPALSGWLLFQSSLGLITIIRSVTWIHDYSQSTDV